ncbi:MAG: hypothetical protein WC816_10020 [Sphingomonas sp.]|jgi:hypothetical protein
MTIATVLLLLAAPASGGSVGLSTSPGPAETSLQYCLPRVDDPIDNPFEEICDVVNPPPPQPTLPPFPPPPPPPYAD